MDISPKNVQKIVKMDGQIYEDKCRGNENVKMEDW